MLQAPPNLLLMQTRSLKQNLDVSGTKMPSSWHDQMISDDCTVWKEHTEMCCNHREPHKELHH